MGRNVAPDIFDQKSREKSKLGRNVAGRNVVGEKCHQGEMSFSLCKYVPAIVALIVIPKPIIENSTKKS